MNEQRAIELCVKHRDPIGFEYLVAKYKREAHFHAYALLGNREDAAEACQESFASAFASLPLLTELEAFYPWFYRVLRNRCLNVLARRRTAATYARDQAHGEPITTEGPHEALVRAEEAAEILAVLGALRLEFREILALKYLRDCDYETLSAVLGIPRGTVMSRLHHARKAFQNAYCQRTGDGRTTPALAGEPGYG